MYLSVYTLISTDILKISETKVDVSFPESQFFFIGYHSLFRFDLNKNVRAMFESIPAKPLRHDYPFIDFFFVEMNLHKKR